jgi:Holliday junction resolvase RusA-like endonuclease
MSSTELLIEVFGDPASQGSHSVINGRIVQVNSTKHKRWRNAVVFAALDLLPEDWKPIDAPVELSVIFYLPRPKSAPGREFPAVMPDLDKLVRAVADSLTDAGIYSDDSRIVRLTATKVYADHRGAGALIRVNTLDKP